MKYILFRVIKKLQFHWFAYSLIFIEITIGFALFLVGANAAISAKDKLSSFKAQVSADNISINSYARQQSTMLELKSSPVTVKDHQNTTALSNGAEPNFLTINHASILLSENNISTITIFFISNRYAGNLLGVDFSQNTVYASKQISNLLKSKSAVSLDDWLIIKDAKIATSNSELVEVKALPDTVDKKIYLNATLDFDTENCIFMPINFMPDNLFSGICLLQLDNASNLPKSDVSKILSYLVNEHDNIYNYTATNSYRDVDKRIADFTKNTDLLGAISVLLFFIVSFGLIGVILIFLNRRRPSIAIALALGADMKISTAELFLEMFLLYFAGCISSVVIVFFALPLFSTAAYTLSLHIQSVALVIVMAVILSLLVCANIINVLYQLSPTQVLSGEM